MNPSDITRHLHNESASREVFDLIQAEGNVIKMMDLSNTLFIQYEDYDSDFSCLLDKLYKFGIYAHGFSKEGNITMLWLEFTK